MFCTSSTLGRLVILLLCVSGSSAAMSATVPNPVAKWHPIQLDVTGPRASELDTSPNPFLDYRLTVEFQAPSGAISIVPGFFAGDGNGGGEGNIWRARFSADEIGEWQYRAELKAGNEIAINLQQDAGLSVTIDGANGAFEVIAPSSDAPQFLRHGRLEYVGSHYMKFRDGPYWIKGGTDSPENLLGFSGIDGTFDHGGVGDYFLHDYEAHRSDWRDTDPYFTHATTGADSQGLIGAINYLGDKGVNSVYFLPMNLGGDGQETYPFVAAENNRFNKTHYDVSKLFQWNIVLNHAQQNNIALNIVLSETEPANEQWLDNGEIGVERRLFFRELVARFGYLLAVKWNLGEENDYPRVELDKHADYIQAIDWSDKPIAVHTHINQFYRYGEIVGDSRYSASSIQYDPQFAGEFVEQWRRQSREAGHPWVIDMDENTDGLAPVDTPERRKEILYDVLFSGGNIEWYFGYNPQPLGGDIDAGDFRLREAMWDQMRYAREMMQAELPFWRMDPADELLQADSDSYGGAEVFAAKGEVYAVYLPETNGNEWLNLEGVDGVFESRWFDPRTGQMHAAGTNLAGNSHIYLGTPPSQTGQDWVALITRTDVTVANTTNDVPSVIDDTSTIDSYGESGTVSAESGDVVENTDTVYVADTTNQDMESVIENIGPRFVNIPEPFVTPGQTYQWLLTATDSNSTNPSVTASSLPVGMWLNGYGNGQLEINWTIPEDATEKTTFKLIAVRAGDSSLRTEATMTIQLLNNVDIPNTIVSDQAVSNELATMETGALLRFIPNMAVQVGQTLIHRVEVDTINGQPPGLNVWNAPDGAEFLDNGDGSRTFLWTPTASDIGLRTITFAARDEQSGELVDTLNVEIQITQ